MNLSLKVTDESTLLTKYHNDIWECELNLLQEISGQSCSKKFPCGLYDLKVPKVFGESQIDLEIQRVELIGGEHLTLFAWLTDNENCAKVALQVV